jgi:hypothetical protein
MPTVGQEFQPVQLSLAVALDRLNNLPYEKTMTPQKTIFSPILSLCLFVAPSLYADDKPDKTPHFEADVLPLFTTKCNRCHGSQKRGGKLDMRTVESLLKGGVSGSAIKPGDAKKSLLIEMLHYDEMPPRKEQPRITHDELKMLRAWVDSLKP